MENVAIFPIVNQSGESSFRAVAATCQSEGRTAGEALDAIFASLSPESAGTVVVVLTSESVKVGE